MNKKALKDWELELGIKIKDKKRNDRYSEKQFKKIINSNYITIKTEKGLEYLKNM